MPPLIVASLMLAQVFPPTPNFVTKHGLVVYVHGGLAQHKADIERVTDIAIDTLSRTFKVPTEALTKRMVEERFEVYVRVRRYGEEGSCPSEANPKRRCYGFICGDVGMEGWCEGYFSAYLRRVDYVAYDCIGDSALPHELIHFVEYLVRNEVSRDHADVSLFPDGCVGIKNTEKRRACYRNSAERVIQRAARNAVCERPRSAALAH